MPCCLLDRNTIIEHTSALWPTGECLTLAQFCPDQGSDTGKWWRKYFLCQGDLGTLFSTLSPLKANGGEKKKNPTLRSQVWISWASGLTVLHPFALRTRLCCVLHRPDQVVPHVPARYGSGTQSRRSSTVISPFSAALVSC